MTSRARSRRHRQLQAVVAALRTRYGDHIIRLAAEVAALPAAAGMPPLSTGSLALDLLTGGLPRGALTEVAGPDGAGRGSLAYAALAACQRDGGMALLVDADNAADPDALAAAGVDLESLILACPASAAEAWDILRALTRCGALDLLVLASLTGVLGLPGAGWGAGYLERRLARLGAVLRGRRTAVLVTNQPAPPRWNAGGAGMLVGGDTLWSPETVGGRSVAQAASLRIALRPRGVRFTAYGDVAGLLSHAWVVKHHGAPRGPLMPLEIGTGGPRRAAELVMLAEACGCLTHTSLGLRAVGTVLGRTAERAAQALEADGDLAAALEAEVRAAWAREPFPQARAAGTAG